MRGTPGRRGSFAIVVGRIARGKTFLRPRGIRSLAIENQVGHPALGAVWTFVAAVREDARVFATSVLQSIRENGQCVRSAGLNGCKPGGCPVGLGPIGQRLR